jgi:acyl-coenzyme A thioesterase PaaI-like protein
LPPFPRAHPTWKGFRSGKIIAIGNVIKKGQQVAFTEGYVRKATDDGDILSQTRASFMIIGETKQQAMKSSRNE